jgi:hypothetical protein
MIILKIFMNLIIIITRLNVEWGGSMHLIKNTGKHSVYLERHNYRGTELVAYLKAGAEKYVNDLDGLRIRLQYGLGEARTIEITNPYVNQFVQLEKL